MKTAALIFGVFGVGVGLCIACLLARLHSSAPYREAFADGVAYQQCIDKGGTSIQNNVCVKVEPK